ncbi:MAG: ABC transporter substrate-binding protein [Chloroflexi bacterium]|nr:ABC transporter substrate-binding protein [Chloroflexota bacterium]
MRRSLLFASVVMVAALFVIACQAAPAPSPPPAQPKASEKESPKAAEAPKPVAKEAAKPAPAAAPKEAAPKAAASLAPEVYEAAKREGEVIWYHTASPEDSEGLVATFNKRYPGIKVSIVTVKASETPARIIAESSAGRLSLDVASGSLNIMQALLSRDLIVGYDWARLSDVPARSIVLGDKLISVYEYPYGWVYNTKLVPPANVPKTWDDVLTPAWKGRKIGILTGGALGFEGLSIQGTWSKEKYQKFLADLKAQEPHIEPSGAGLAQRVAAGQIPMGVFPMTLLPKMLKDGAPVDVAPLGPMQTRRQVVYTMKGVPHPNASKLFMAWLGSSEAFPEWDKQGRGPLVPCNASVVAKILCDKKIDLFIEDTLEKSEKLGEHEEMQRKLFTPLPG